MDFVLVLLYTTLPGGAGGLASFLLGLKRGHYRNDKYAAKFSIEIFGAMVTASFLVLLLPAEDYRIPIAFVIGIAWASILQSLRTKITKIVEAALGDHTDPQPKQ